MPTPHRRAAQRPAASPARRETLQPPVAQPIDERELDELQALLDGVPAPLEPLDVDMLDGFLCGVLVQPSPVPASRWLPHITDADGRALPPRFDAKRLHTLAQRRHVELDQAIRQRRWFDPWVFELSDSEAAPPQADLEAAPAAIDAVYPWVAGFAAAMELFPALLGGDARALTEPLALLYRHLDADDLEDADELLAEIESMEPPADLTDAVEGLVRATLLLADVGRPLATGAQGPLRPPPRPRATARQGAPGRAPRRR